MKMETGKYQKVNLKIFIKKGKIKVQNKSAVDKLINKSIPIEAVPAWFENVNVPNEAIVVRPLKSTANGVELFNIFSILLKSKALFIM